MQHVTSNQQTFEKLDGIYRSVCVPSIENKGHRIKAVKPINKGRHKLIATQDNLKFYFIFKRAVFGTYAEQFDGEKAVGESINIDRLWFCIDNKIDYILIGYPDGKIYSIKPQEWLEYANKHNTYRKVERKDYDKKNGIIEEKTASIDIRKLKRWN